MRMGTWQMFFRGLRRLSVGVAIAGSLSGCTVAFDRIALPVDTQIAEVGGGCAGGFVVGGMVVCPRGSRLVG